MDTVTASATALEAVLLNTDNDVRFRMDISGVADETFRVRIREAYPKVPRFEVPHVLDGDPEQAQVEVKDRCVQSFYPRLSFVLPNTSQYTQYGL